MREYINNIYHLEGTTKQKIKALVDTTTGA